ncbi:MAG TPA: hypothetical protein VLV78_00610 [Thermoanaerobaculia bacterium]|nr:hypothetical protein [Thermoanaerobaculia bacterium]
MTPERRSLAVSAAAVFLCSALICLAARGDLWLDEIWSVSFARGASTPIDLLEIHHDNNHLLNTAWLYLMRWQQASIIYRALAILSGIGSVIIAGSIARQWGKTESIAATLLIGTSYPLVLYFSEARGYAPAIFCALAAYRILQRNSESDPIGPAAMFWIACIAGILSHLTFAMVLVAFAIASVVPPYAMPLRRLAMFHGAPILFAAGWYAYFARDMVFGRGPVYPTGKVVLQAAAILLGLPDLSLFGILSIAAVVLIVIGGAFALRRHGDPQWLFFPALCLAAPAILLVAAHPRYLYFRYFVICFPFFYLVLAYLIGRFARPGRTPVAAVVVLLLVSMQAGRLYTLIALGRGHYRDALRTMSAGTRGEVIRVGSDDDVANGLVLKFYSTVLPPAQTLRYIPLGEWQREPPEWFIFHTQKIDEEPAPGLALRGGGVYDFVERYPFEGTSGFEWFLFRRRGSH